MRRRPPRSKLTVQLFPDTALFRSFYASGGPKAASVRRPGHGVAGGGRAAPPIKGMSRRPIGLNGAGEVRLVVFLPGMPVGTAFRRNGVRSEEHRSGLQSLMRISYAVF